MRRVGLDLAIDFDTQRIDGAAVMLLDRRAADRPLVLDTRALDIIAIDVAREMPSVGARLSDLALARDGFASTSWRWGAEDAILGRALVIDLPRGASIVRVRWRTHPDASGLQWLAPAQTADGTHPFLYSQSQPIHARSWFPCQDSPGARVVYDAVVRVRDPQLVALMSADRGQAGEGTFAFDMPQPIPPYLVALAVGRLEFAEVGRRTGVWAEPSVLPLAKRETVDVERMLAAAESLAGPYRWGRYDLLVLPPAFPFGGMENPKLTFATPTILAGDRSLISLVAHELAHSWSGNLVTNSTWADIWLNEGFTVYLERRIVESIYGARRAAMEAEIGRADLDEAIARVGDADERLRLDLRGRDPDDGMSDVAYEKGALLLRALEQEHGRARFDVFLRQWFDRHAFASVTTETFERAVEGGLPGSTTSLAEWLDGAGVPADARWSADDPFVAVDRELARFAAGGTAAEIAGDRFSVHEWLHFIRALPEGVSSQRLAELDRVWRLGASGNAEIAAAWFEVAVLRGHRAVDERLAQFLRKVGRRKFLAPLYEALIAAGRADEARRIYAAARAGYHPIARAGLDELLGKPP